MQDSECLFQYLGYDLLDQGRIAVITLDRPKQRNAQNRGMLVELGSAFERAEAEHGPARRPDAAGGTPSR